jgi:6-pyruvoyltetrahydropterin/6-carboxytetrahydropterin synthase
MFIIRKEFAFSASHQLMGLPPEHPCSRLHGHNYVVTVELISHKVNEVGFIQDYRELDFIKKYLDETKDHRHLNDCFLHNPTAELMAESLFQIFKPSCPQLRAVEVSETPKTTARYQEFL